jgi:hypothetical protein
MQSRLPLLIGLSASLLVHQAVLLPWLVVVMTAQGRPHALQARLDPEDFRKTPPEPEETLDLGLDVDTDATLTWVGYEEYQEHLAALAEVEQAAFTQDPTPAGPTQVGAVAPVSDPAEEASDAKPTEAPQPQQVVKPGETEAPKKVEAKATKAPEKETTSPSKADPDARKGDPSDRESDATSTIDVPLADVQIGKPLAARGLELKPARPRFTTLIQLSAAPGNPLCEMRFRRDGVPAVARIVEGSGDPRVDSIIRSSLYRWRASGKPLKELRREQTINVQIRILLSNRRPRPAKSDSEEEK